MLALKLKPVGKKHQRSFRLIVDQKKHKLLGKDIEDLGWYNPHTNGLEFKKDRVLYWIKSGAQPTDTVHNLLIRAGILTGKKRAVHAKSEKPAEEAGTASEDAAGNVQGEGEKAPE